MPKERTSLSERLFGKLLRVFPGDFRRRYGGDMRQVFRDQRRDALIEGGRMGLLRLWTNTLKGVVQTAPGEHWAILRQDALYALRTMRRSKGTTLAAVLTLGLGIGANTCIFGVVNAILLRPLPFREDHRLTRIYMSRQGAPPYVSLQTGLYLEVEEQGRFFEGIAAQRYTNMTLLGTEGALRLAGQGVTAGWLDVLGVEPYLGRGFLPAEEEQGVDSLTVVISHAFWGSHFGLDPQAVGSRLMLDGRPFTVVGVMPPGFAYPYANDLWFPINLHRQPEGLWGLNVQARLKPGVSLEQARAELRVLGRRLQSSHPELIRGMDLTAIPTRQVLLDDDEGLVLALMAAVGFVLLIVCVNVGNLLLARSVTRRREMAIRTALGAVRLRQIRQLLTESLLLALIGGGTGLALALWASRFMGVLVPGRMSNLLDGIPVDWTVLSFTLAATLLTGLLFGLAPALRAVRGGLEGLREGGRSQGSPVGHRLPAALLTAQMALSLVLLAGAGAMVRDLLSRQRAELGYSSSRLAVFTVPLDGDGYTQAEQRIHAVLGIEERLKALPAVEQAGVTNIFPSHRGAFLADVAIEGRPVEEDRRMLVHNRFVSPGFFESMGIPILRGRGIERSDNAESLPVTVISASMAKRYWPEEEPIGQRIRNQRREDSPWLTIVGVAGDVREYYDVDDAWYLPFAQNANSADAGAAVFAVRAESSPKDILSALPRAVREFDPRLPVFDLMTVEQLYAESLSGQRLTTTLMSLFAAFGLLMAALGICGVMAFAVNRRIHEIGVRRALGAHPRQIMGEVVRQAAATALLGITIGIVGVLALDQLLSHLVEGAEASDPALLVLVSALLLTVALAACCIPARRAARVDPLTALRCD